MTEFLKTPMFGMFLTCFAWTAGVWLQKKTGWKLCYPLVVATALVIGLGKRNLRRFRINGYFIEGVADYIGVRFVFDR